jgi:hypothetical protein
MTFDDDFLLIAGKRISCKQLNLEWPPPEEINLWEFDWVRVRYSQITDGQRGDMTCVIRGAEYKAKEKNL